MSFNCSKILKVSKIGGVLRLWGGSIVVVLFHLIFRQINEAAYIRFMWI